MIKSLKTHLVTVGSRRVVEVDDLDAPRRHGEARADGLDEGLLEGPLAIEALQAGVLVGGFVDRALNQSRRQKKGQLHGQPTTRICLAREDGA